MQHPLFVRLHELITRIYGDHGPEVTRPIHEAVDSLEHDATFMTGLLESRGITLSESTRAHLRCEREALSTYPTEHYIAIGLDAEGEVTRRLGFCDHDPVKVSVDVQAIVEALTSSGSAALLTMHNHPSGGSCPSGADDGLSQRLRFALKPHHLILFDEQIVEGVQPDAMESWLGVLGMHASRQPRRSRIGSRWRPRP